ncbi:hypothetical protein M427DRAFT_70025 [Gonapodya prolifera JEL478]|uniref:Peptidyl-prolyl cis-trans isomerase n=1 Tax=Gonapodya prolifera (strain JEL478) TaxID=1344416 RepID=A0A139AF74_GONPJ|nr:hypothetical protein M427DRAFT_70025 [Gonapodya prolifera JEL478]|eukprot:KXS15408.1 hypothetical protein M427DRAFT_70025 [Gonapodya prolifera JEL478]
MLLSTLYLLLASVLLLPATQAAIHDVDITTHVFLDVSRGDVPLGRIVVGLYGNTAPKTVQSFRMLATGERGYGYKGTRFHRVIKGFVVQTGDWEYSNGTGSRSIYGATFSDEPKGLQLSHSAEGVLSMANKGPNKNGSQFFITLNPQLELNGKHTVFGRVVSGLDVVLAIGESVTNSNDRPLLDVVIEDCGEIDFASGGGKQGAKKREGSAGGAKEEL